jgi:signal transduction histidine kinase
MPEDIPAPSEDLQFLCQSAMEFADLPPRADVHQVLGRLVKKVVGDALVCVSAYEPDTRTLRPRAFFGAGKLLPRIVELLGRSPLDLHMSINNDDAWEGLTGATLTQVPGGLYEAALNAVPKSICNTLERLFRINAVHAIGLTRRGQLFGTVGIITRVTSRAFNAGTIETLVRQASTALQRQKAEEELAAVRRHEADRVAQELHDVLGQDLVAISFLTKALEGDLAVAQRPEAEQAREVVQRVGGAITRTRMLARGLCSMPLAGGDFVDCVRVYCTDVEKLYGVGCRVLQDAAFRIENDGRAEGLYRIIQEAVINSIRHGQATEITIRLHRGASGIVVGVLDNGVGLPETPAEHAGMGLRIMQHRARGIGGLLDIMRPDEGGTFVKVTCPEEADRVTPTAAESEHSTTVVAGLHPAHQD